MKRWYAALFAALLGWPSLLKEAAATIKELKAEVEALGREHDTATREWALAEARAAKAEEALRRIARDRGGFMGEYHAECQQIDREALGEEKA